MRRKVGLEGNKTLSELSEEFYQAAEEDYAYLEYARKTDFTYCGNACMLASRYAEKMLKARLLRNGIDPDWGHDLLLLIQKLPPFDGRSRALDLAAEISPYATQAAYPSLVRDTITPDKAREAYDSAMEIVRLTSVFDGGIDRRPKQRQETLFSRKTRKSSVLRRRMRR